MPDYTYLIVGGGMTADAAAQALHEADPAGSIGLISAEPHPPYDRPPLSKPSGRASPKRRSGGRRPRRARRCTWGGGSRRSIHGGAV